MAILCAVKKGFLRRNEMLALNGRGKNNQKKDDLQRYFFAAKYLASYNGAFKKMTMALQKANFLNELQLFVCHSLRV